MSTDPLLWLTPMMNVIVTKEKIDTKKISITLSHKDSKFRLMV
jgi:hypothetical protein